MRIGTVIGRVWASKKIDAMPAGALLVVDVESQGTCVALDLLGCGEGEKVLLAADQAVSVATQDKPGAVDLVVVATLDS